MRRRSSRTWSRRWIRLLGMLFVPALKDLQLPLPGQAGVLRIALPREVALFQGQLGPSRQTLREALLLLLGHPGVALGRGQQALPLADAEQIQHLLDALGAPLAESQVVFAAAALVGVTLNRDLRPGMLAQVARVRFHQRAVFVLYIVAIELVVDAALRRLGSGGCSRTQGLLSRRRGLRCGAAGLRRRRRRGLINRRFTGARGEKGRHDGSGDGDAASPHGELPWLRRERESQRANYICANVCARGGARSEILGGPPSAGRTRPFV